MLKILYAASNNSNAKIQLQRFLQAIDSNLYEVKVAAYKNSSPEGVSIDWTLDCLLNIFKPNHINALDNENFILYHQQIKYFNPDLIISDLEYFTSLIAIDLNITLWQCSASLIASSLVSADRYNLGLFKKYSYVFSKDPLHVQRIANIIDNSNCNFVYSHFGDIEIPPTLKSNFEWIRPYHLKGKKSLPCQHNIVAGCSNSNKQIITLLKQYEDCIFFTDFTDEKYKNIILKDLSNIQEYSCNLFNCNSFVCEGQTSFLADAYYNNKFALILTNYQDSECIINASLSDKLGFGKPIYSNQKNIEQYLNNSIKHNLNYVKMLHQKIEEIL